MEALEALSTRRSIRTYQDRPIPEDALRTILGSGMDAPSAMDQQAWHFVVVRDGLAEIPSAHNHSELVTGAAAAIVVCVDSGLEKLPGFWPQDLAACSQNILLAAHALGIGGVWIGVHPTEENVTGLRSLLGLPENVTPFSLLALGYPAEPYPAKENFKQDRIHYEKW